MIGSVQGRPRGHGPSGSNSSIRIERIGGRPRGRFAGRGGAASVEVEPDRKRRRTLGSTSPKGTHKARI